MPFNEQEVIVLARRVGHPVGAIAGLRALTETVRTERDACVLSADAQSGRFAQLVRCYEAYSRADMRMSLWVCDEQSPEYLSNLRNACELAQMACFFYDPARTLALPPPRHTLQGSSRDPGILDEIKPVAVSPRPYVVITNSDGFRVIANSGKMSSCFSLVILDHVERMIKDSCWSKRLEYFRDVMVTQQLVRAFIWGDGLHEGDRWNLQRALNRHAERAFCI